MTSLKRVWFPGLCIATCVAGAAYSWSEQLGEPVGWVDERIAQVLPHVSDASVVILITDHRNASWHHRLKYALAPRPVLNLNTFGKVVERALDGGVIVARFTDRTLLRNSLSFARGQAESVGIEVDIQHVGGWTLLRARKE